MNNLNIANNSEKLSVIDLIYPIGSTYLTFDASFDPNIQWGGYGQK